MSDKDFDWTECQKFILGITDISCDKGLVSQPFIDGAMQAWEHQAATIKQLEEFMVGVAAIVKCLPDYTQPSLEEGNSHIKRKLEALTQGGKGE